QDRLHVALLVGAARADVALAGAQGDVRRRRRLVRLLHAGFLQEQMDHVRRQLGALGLAVQATQQGFGGLGDIAGADQLELVATVADFQCQSLFDQAQVLVELAAEIGEAVGFKGFEGEAMRFYGGVQGLLGDRARQIRKTKNSAVNGKKQRNAKKPLNGIAVGPNSFGQAHGRIDSALQASADQRAPQRVRQRVVDLDLDELADQARIVATEIDDAVVLGAALQHARIFLGIVRDENALGGAHHPSAVLEADLADAVLEDRQPLFLHFFRRLVDQLRGWRAGACAVDERIGKVEADVLYQLHGLLEVLVGLAGEADDEIRADQDVRHRRLELANARLVLQRRMVALHP